METEFKLHRLYQSGMVLLQNAENCISGYAAPLSSVTVTFRDRSFSCTAEADGTWELLFAAGSAGGPFTLKAEVSDGQPPVSGKASSCIELNDVYVGEVWVGSGQSNMQLPLERLKYSYPEEYAAEENPFIRFFTVPIEYGFDGPHADLNDGRWVCASPENTPALAGTAYFFAKSLWQSLGIPVGFINASQGGSPITSWLDESVIKKYPVYLEELDACRDEDDVERRKQAHAHQNDEWMETLNAADAGLSGGWDKTDFPADAPVDEVQVPGRYGKADFAGVVWFKKTFELTADELALCQKNGAGIWLGRITDADTVWINGICVGGTGYQYPPRRYSVPSEALKEGTNTVTVRVISSGCSGGIEFALEKPYVFFAGTALDPLFEKQMSGVWKCIKGCSTCPGSGDFFPEWCATALYNKMLAPVTKTAVRGFVWYQGESNAAKPDEYEFLLKDLIAQVRRDFVHAPDAAQLPFIIAQLPNCGPKDMCASSSASASPEGWARMREVQASVADSTENAGLAVLLDSGEWNDLHPENKLAVGWRLAREALRIVYGKKLSRSPRFRSLQAEKSHVIVHFETDGSPLMAGKLERMKAFALPMKAGDSPAEAFAGNPVLKSDFAAIYKDDSGNRRITAIPARITGPDTVEIDVAETLHASDALAAEFAGTGEVFKSEGAKLVEIRCLWASSPDNVTLYNKDGIPVCPFRVVM